MDKEAKHRQNNAETSFKLRIHNNQQNRIMRAVYFSVRRMYEKHSAKWLWIYGKMWQKAIGWSTSSLLKSHTINSPTVGLISVMWAC